MPKQAVHDRRSTDLPIGSIVATAYVQDPYSESGEYIKVFRSLRDDPLAGLLARQQIDKAQFEAGRQWQKYAEDSEIGSLRAIDPAKEAVDGGRLAIDPLGPRQIRAAAKIVEADKTLGQEGAALIRDILGLRLTIIEAASRRGLTSEIEIKYIGRRFRECLESLAKLWGFA